MIFKVLLHMSPYAHRLWLQHHLNSSPGIPQIKLTWYYICRVIRATVRSKIVIELKVPLNYKVVEASTPELSYFSP